MEGVHSKMPKTNFDFGGYATKNNVKCSDGRVILPDAFKDNDGTTVPLVWQHMHDSPQNILGHAVLENREDGVYAYAYLNDSDDAKRAKTLVQHGDITAFSIYANSLVEKALNVAHGVIREVSLVLSGANPGAKIDFVSLAHGDGSLTELDDEAIITMGSQLDLPAKEEVVEEEEEVIEHADDETVGDVFETLSEKQKNAVYVIVGQLLEGDEDLAQSADSNSNEEGDTDNIMKNNVFDGSAVESGQKSLTHAQMGEIFATARKVGSLKEAVLEHAGTYGIDNIDYLFPDARNVTKEPTWVARRMEWVSGVLNGTKHSPFSRIKSLHADITADEARALGYVTGNLKVEEVFPILRRITTPTTIYKKQKLDRDDIVDITDFNVVSWLKQEMRVMLDEEIARAILVGDGRDPVGDADNHINTANLRPIYTDDAVYVHNVQVALARTNEEMIDDLISARTEYRGSGNPTLYAAPSLVTAWLLLRDTDGYRMYKTKAELAAELGVKEIVEVPVMAGVQNDYTTPTHNLRAIIVNLADYTIGADRGGEINFFDDFDIDYNQYKYLIETRISGALVVPKSAITLEQAIA
jgi:HK97 family phage prohead protease